MSATRDDFGIVGDRYWFDPDFYIFHPFLHAPIHNGFYVVHYHPLHYAE